MAVTGCSGSSSAPASAPPPTPAASTAPTPTADAAAQRVVARAAGTTASTHSYNFTAVNWIGSGAAARTRISGRFVRGQGIAYVLTAGSKRTEVVRLNRATYVRAVPGRWARLRHPHPLVDPTTTLLAVLQGLTPTDVSHTGAASTVHGVLASSAAGHAGLPAGVGTVKVTAVVDRHGDVRSLVLRTNVTVKGHPLPLLVRTSYTRFDHAASIRRPV